MNIDAKILHSLFPSILFFTSGQKIHLTFDDGPHPKATTDILNILKNYNIAANFFVLGENARRYPELLQEIKSYGHQIGNHSYSHDNLFFRNKSEIRKSILRTEETLEKAIGISSRYFRPPYGYFNPAVLSITKELQMTCVLWNVNSRDYILHRQKNIVSRVAPKVTWGSILLFHDNEATSQSVSLYLPFLIETLLKKNFMFDTLTI